MTETLRLGNDFKLKLGCMFLRRRRGGAGSCLPAKCVVDSRCLTYSAVAGNAPLNALARGCDDVIS